MRRDEETRERPLHEEEEWDIYNDEAREKLVESDSLDPEEEAFMRGYEGA
ncbi:hypothetical protein JXA12_03290 [Candidatus Woesearchaeota archaeon]|nr:hypothetical protein [Candidatus Woesearchaeota archaeon]